MRAREGTALLGAFARSVREFGLVRVARFVLAERILFRWGVRTQSPYLVAVALFWCFRPLQKKRRKSGTPIMVLLPKLGGEEDFLAALDAREDHPFFPVKWPRKLIGELFDSIVDEASLSIRRNAYLSLSKVEKMQSSAYENFLIRVFEELENRSKIAAFVTANIAYVGQREMAIAAQRRGIPFLVMHKECVKSEGQRALFEEFYRDYFGKFSGSAISVYNRNEKASLESSLGVPPELVVVTGCPRIDRLHESRLKQEGNGTEIVLFSIDRRVGVLSPLDAIHQRTWPDWKNMAQDVERWFVSLAKSFPEASFTLKVKLGTEAQVRERLLERLPKNLTVVFGGSGTDLVRSSRVIVAFNSTVISEGLARGVPVLVPNAKSWFRCEVSTWTHDYGSAVHLFSSQGEFERLVYDSVSRPVSSGARMPPITAEKLREYVGNDDGLAGARAIAFLDRFSRI